MKAQRKTEERSLTLRTALIALAMLGLGLSACTKAKEQKSKVDPNFYVSKSDYEGKSFSIVRGTEEASKDSGATPGFSEDLGYATVRITETEIQFIQLYDLGERKQTMPILASFPIRDHFDIQRETNDFGESTHRIVENREKPWNQRKYMRVDWSTPTNGYFRFSGISVSGRATENLVALEDPKNENGHISWLTEVSMTDGEGWAPGSRAVVRTHLMPVKVTDFEKLKYRDKDFKRFGYFYTRQNISNPEKGPLDSERQENTFANLHNVCEPGRTDANGNALSCSTNKIVWHLNKEFPDKYLAGARQLVQEWNQTFKEALNRKDNVVVLDESTRVNTVDPRYNTIAVYTGDTSSGLLGVAQEVINPETGEAIASRATVYEDGIRGQMGWVDDIITAIINDEETRQTFMATDAEAQERILRLFGKSESRLRANLEKVGVNAPQPSGRMAMNLNRSNGAGGFASGIEARKSIKEIIKRNTEPVGRSLARRENLMKAAPELFQFEEMAKIGGSIAGYEETFGRGKTAKPTASRLPKIDGLENIYDLGQALREERARMINQAETGIHGAELVEDAAVRYIRKVLAKYPNIKDFKSQVETVKADIEQKTFYTTLVHEMGHTFGLRHNFQGSADGKHYHSEFYRLEAQLKAEAELPPDQRTVTPADLQPYMFSSIMDYGGDFYSQIGGIGPYDKAAIRYAYNRSIDRENDAVVKANYQFCTDHQVNESIVCRRFDKGRNVSEITLNQIESYQTNWVLSHYRRDRVNFDRGARRFPMRVLVGTFIPVRQVMDEYLYALVDNKSVPAKQNECDIDYWRRSVDKGEITNVCHPVMAERDGVDVTDLETFEKGLFDPKTGDFRKAPVDYEPYGLADLVFANALAKEFFTDVLGSTEPGTYIAMPVARGVFNLEPLPAGGTLEERLQAFADDQGIDDPKFLEMAKGLVGEIKPGRYGKPFNSEADEDGPFVKQKNIGSFWDKYMAMVALGIKDLGVSKYDRRSLVGNAYSFPQTTGFAKNLFRQLITQEGRISTIPFKVSPEFSQDGVVFAHVTPSLNKDTQAIATVTALTDFVSDQDLSVADKLRVCSVNEQGCRAPFGQKTVEFTTASGQDMFRATQTIGEDSIAFDILTAAAKLDATRKEWVVKLQKAQEVNADNIMKLAKLNPMRAKVRAAVETLNMESLKFPLELLLADKAQDPKSKKPVGTLWSAVNVIVTQSDKVPLFATQSIAQQAGGMIGFFMDTVAKEVEAIDPDEKCKPVKKEEPINPALVRNGNGPLPPVMGLNARLANALANNAPANGGGNSAPECADINKRRGEIEAVMAEVAPYIKDMNDIVSTTMQAKVAPLRVKRATDQLARAEANIRLVRRVSKATGLE